MWGLVMLTLSGGEAESLVDLGLPVLVVEVPEDLAGLDRLLDDRGLLAPIEAAWAVTSRAFGRPSIAMDRLVRLMVIKGAVGRVGL